MASTTLTRPPQETLNARKERCERCRFWCEFTREEQTALRFDLRKFARRFGGHANEAGFCHRYPPTYRSSFPITYADDWCGEFRG